MVENNFSHINIYNMEPSLTEPNAEEISEEEKKNIISLQEYIDDLNKRQKWRHRSWWGRVGGWGWDEWVGGTCMLKKSLPRV